MRSERFLDLKPIAIERGYVLLGYTLYLLLSLTFVVFGAPSLDLVSFPGYTQGLGGALTVLAIVAIWAARRDRYYPVETVAVVLMASGYAAYCYAVFRVIAERGLGVEGRAAFAVVVFIVTALLWGHGLSNLYRLAYDVNQRRRRAAAEKAWAKR